MYLNISMLTSCLVDELKVKYIGWNKPTYLMHIRTLAPTYSIKLIFPIFVVIEDLLRVKRVASKIVDQIEPLP